MIVEQAVKDLSQKSGLNPEDIRTHIEDWAIPLMTKGIIVRLMIHRWRGKTRLTREELGLDINSDEWQIFSSTYLSLGNKRLLPRRISNIFSRLENSARKILAEYSFDTVWGSFVPCTVFQIWKERNEVIKTEYYRQVQEVAKIYPQIIAEVCEEYKNFTKVLYKKINSSQSYEQYESNFIENILASMPEVDLFIHSFSFDSLYYYIPLPSDIEREACLTAEIANEKEKANAERKMRDMLMQETLKQKSQYIEQFLTATVGKIREMVMDIVLDIKNGMSIDRSVSGCNKKKVLQMIDKIRMLDFYDDNEVRDALDKLQIDLEKEPKFRSESEIMFSLEELEIKAKAGIKNIFTGRHNLLEI